MTNDLIPFDNDQVPAHLQPDATNNDDLSGGVSSGYPIISIKGKRWAVVRDGGTTPLVKRQDGDEIPVPFIDVVIVKANPLPSKVYYAGGYTEGDTSAPDCYSNDGIEPAPDAANPQSVKCANCPMNVWGSKITENGSKTKACADSRRLAIAAPSRLDDPMLLRVPAASLKELSTYSRMLKERNAPYQGVLTRIKFDDNVAYPRLLFKPLGWLSKEQYDNVMEQVSTAVVEDIVGVKPKMKVQENVGQSKPSGGADAPSTPKQTEPVRAESKDAGGAAASDKLQSQEQVAQKEPETVSDDLASVLASFDD